MTRLFVVVVVGALCGRGRVGGGTGSSVAHARDCERFLVLLLCRTDVDEGIVLDEASGMDIIQVTEEDDDPQEVVGSENPSTHELDNAELLIRPLGIEPETAIVTADSSS